MRHLPALLLLFTCSTSAFAETGRGWSPWYKLDDGGLNGIEFSHKNDCPPGGAAVCTHHWRFHSGYETPVEINYTITWVESSIPRNKSERVNLPPGVTESAVFTVRGTALDEVTVRLVADKKILAEARKEVTEEIKRKENDRRRKEEAERKAELARKSEQERQEKIARAAALPYQQDEPAEVTSYRNELMRKQEVARQAEEETRRRKEEAQQREEERIAQEERRREEARQERAEQRRQDRKEEQRKEEREAELKAQEKARQENLNRIITQGAQEIGQSLNAGIKRVYDAKMQGIQLENQAREQQRQAKVEAERQLKQQQEEARRERERVQREKERREKERREAQQVEQERQRMAKLEQRRQEAAATNDVAASYRRGSTSYLALHSDWVNRLLDRSGPWSCPSSPPKIKADTCMRDSYVASAVQYAWAAECYAEQGEKNRAVAHAELMNENLKKAKELCSNAPSIAGTSRCDTMEIFSCQAVGYSDGGNLTGVTYGETQSASTRSKNKNSPDVRTENVTRYVRQECLTRWKDWTDSCCKQYESMDECTRKTRKSCVAVDSKDLAKRYEAARKRSAVAPACNPDY